MTINGVRGNDENVVYGPILFLRLGSLLALTASSQENQLGTTPAGTTQSVIGIAHTGETSNAGVEGILIKALDLDDPHIPPEGTFGGFPMFNPGL